MGRIRIGLSGWSYDGWRGDFYPPDLPRSGELAYAARRFDTFEINRTFYGLASPRVFRSWASEVPDDCVFAVKGSRFITHNKKLRDVETALANFFASGVLDLGHRLGPFLWQLPAQLHFDAERIERFVALLPRDTNHAADLARRHDDRVRAVSYGTDTNHRIRHTLEVRHESYLCQQMATIAHRHGVALASSHSSQWPYLEEVSAGFVYVRLHGPDELYSSAYGDAELRTWARRLRTWRAADEPDDAVRISDRRAPARRSRDVYVYFDNDAGGHAPRDASRLRELLEEAVAD